MKQVALVLGILLAAGAAAAESPGRPNVVLFIADDVSWNDFGCYGNAAARTPRVDRLAGRAEHRAAIETAWLAMRNGPIRPAEHPLACVLIDLEARRAAEAPPARVRAHPTAEAFPGPVAAGARPVTRRRSAGG